MALSEPEARKMLSELRSLQMQAEDGERQLASLQEASEQTIATISTLENLSLAQDALFQVGSGVLVKASVVDSQKVLVEMGSRVIMEKSTPDAILLLKERNTQLQATGMRIQERLAQLSDRI